MRIEEITPGLQITLLMTINGQELSFNTRVTDVYPLRHMILAEALYHNDKIISFRGSNLIVNLLVCVEDNKPQIFKNVSISLCKKADNTAYYCISTIAESKKFNRRQSFRCYVGIPSTVACLPPVTPFDATIKDVSISGFSVVCSQSVNLEMQQMLHTILEDYIAETDQHFSFDMHGIIARAQQLENGNILYGCRLNKPLPGLEAYIMLKERLKLRNYSGGH